MILALLLLLAQEALFGSWTIDVAASDNINKAIDAATADLNFIKRPIARSRLRATNEPVQRIVIRMAGDSVEIATDRGVVLRVRPDGVPMAWKGFKGETLQVSATVENGVLTNRFVAEDGERRNAYSLNGQGRLELRVRLSSPQLKRPVEYTRVFQRVDSGGSRSSPQ